MHDIQLEFILNAPLESVYQAFTNSENIQKWFRPLGMTVQQAMVNAKENGQFSLTLSDVEHNQHKLFGCYSVMIENQTLHFSWQWLDEDLTTQVQLDFQNRTAGNTEVHLCHSGFIDEEDVTLHYQAWLDCFDELSIMLSSV